MSFVDRVNVTFKAGDGGDGIVSFRRRFRTLGGPNGGDGGNGGAVILRASHDQNTLATFRYKKLLKAENGRPGMRDKKHGKNGADLEVAVPVGTVVVDQTSRVLADLTVDGQSEVLARGGQGGFGNAHFVSPTREAPKVAEKGEPGEMLQAALELKMIADVGLIGLPNSGKSTLLSVISNAKPEIADYPFTTLVPNLGVVDIDQKTSLLFADIPGLIEGASLGKGLGDEFLRHIERTSLLVHLVDVYSQNIAGDYRTIIQELRDYKIDLSKKPQIVALTKIDGVDKSQVEKQMGALKQAAGRAAIVTAIASPTGEGVKALLRTGQKKVEQIKKRPPHKKAKAELPVIGLREDEDVWMIKKTKEGFVITGRKIERFAARTHFGDYHGQQRLRDIMYKMGIMKELERRGIEPSQKVQIGDPVIGTIDY